VIPDSLCPFLNGSAFFHVIYSNTIQPYPPSRFAGESGILISSEAGAGIAIASFNGTDYDLGLWDNISGAQFEGSAFVDCDVP
jgi:hypothetical protein